MTALRTLYWLCIAGALASGVWIGFMEVDALLERRRARRAAQTYVLQRLQGRRP